MKWTVNWIFIQINLMIGSNTKNGNRIKINAELIVQKVYI